MRQYRATVKIIVDDPEANMRVTEAEVQCDFPAPDDPRTLLVREALEQAAKGADGLERYLWNE